ncbi:hypothetical protein [Gordonia shandongensis]|uniref:hypothetical protein n=1 Tax=Gordonia shandongensis TaxID=376351 RepID=UPI0003F641CB|nr:hypothetical protein [Gordonia shandongensis]
MEFGIDPDQVTQIAAAWRRSGDEMRALRFGRDAEPAGSAAVAELAHCRAAARRGATGQGDEVRALAAALDSFTATTVESDRAAGAAIAATPSS